MSNAAFAAPGTASTVSPYQPQLRAVRDAQPIDLLNARQQDLDYLVVTAVNVCTQVKPPSDFILNLAQSRSEATAYGHFIMEVRALALDIMIDLLKAGKTEHGLKIDRDLKFHDRELASNPRSAETLAIYAQFSGRLPQARN